MSHTLTEITSPCHALECPENPPIYSRWSRTGLTKHNWNGLIALCSYIPPGIFPTRVYYMFSCSLQTKWRKIHNSFTFKLKKNMRLFLYSCSKFFLFIYCSRSVNDTSKMNSSAGTEEGPENKVPGLGSHVKVTWKNVTRTEEICELKHHADLRKDE